MDRHIQSVQTLDPNSFPQLDINDHFVSFFFFLSQRS